MSIYLVLWIVIAAALAIVYFYRGMIESRADELVHLSDVSDAVLEKQEATAGKIQQLDRLVMILAIVCVVYGVVLAGLKVYLALTSPGSGA
jgi:hypothetical protein